MTPVEAQAYQQHLAALQEWSSGGCVGRPPQTPFVVVCGELLDGHEHALRGEATLCGMSSEDVSAMRHLFDPEGRFACLKCAEVARNGRT